MKNQNLSPEELLLLDSEYGYIQATITQTIEDRYKLLNFYIGIGSTIATILVGAITLTQGELDVIRQLSLSSLAIVMWCVGILFTLMFVRLRQAWYSAVTSLNQLKQYISDRSTSDIASALRWRNETLPKIDKLWNIHFYSVVIINIVSGIFLSIFCVLNTANYLGITAALIAGSFAFLANMMFGSSLYLYSLKFQRRVYN